MMQASGKRTTPRNVVAGSVWETRIQNDELEGGVKVFYGEENSEECGGDGDGDVGLPNEKSLNQNQSGGVRERRKTWKPEPVEVIGRTIFHRRKTRSDFRRLSYDSSKELSMSVDGIEKNLIQLKKTRSDSRKVVDENCKEFGLSREKIIEKNPVEVKKTRSDSYEVIDETCEEFGPCREKTISSCLSSMGLVRNQRFFIDEDGVDGGGKDEQEEKQEEQVIEKKSFDVKVVKEEKKLNRIHEKPLPISANANKSSPLALNHRVIDSDLKKQSPISISEDFKRFPKTQHKLQNIVDLVMWRDVSKSALVFGFGAFILISYSYAKDVNSCLVSAMSYMGLLCLATVFIYRSILCRGAVVGLDDSSQIHLVGEEEAICLLKLFLPSLNKFLWKLRALFYGDPSTTMKLAVMLFVLARCGSSITAWNIIKLGFFGVFTVPKLYSSYSNQLSGYGKFWKRRLRDAWDSCSHKKAVSVTVFTLVWSFSTVEARIWAVFMLMVGVRYYQQSSSTT